MPKIKTGTKEWAVANVNIQIGCEHNCRYCYARAMAVRRFRRCTAEQWTKPVIDHNKVTVNQRHINGVVMFPSSHDITPSNISECLCVLHRLLDAGNQVLIVSKPHWDCITVICDFFKEFKKQITFRFSIGSLSDDILSFWEPGAPSAAERLACLIHAYQSGYATSVSCEPYLDRCVIDTYEKCIDSITTDFWIGKLNQFDSRVDLSGVSAEQIKRFVNPLKDAQSNAAVLDLYNSMAGLPRVRWKDSIRAML